MFAIIYRSYRSVSDTPQFHIERRLGIWIQLCHSGSLAIDCDKVHSHSKTTLLNLVSLITFRISIGFASIAASLQTNFAYDQLRGKATEVIIRQVNALHQLNIQKRMQLYPNRIQLDVIRYVNKQKSCCVLVMRSRTDNGLQTPLNI